MPTWEESLIKELEALKKQEAEILTELFSSVHRSEPENKKLARTEVKREMISSEGTRVRLLSRGIISKKGDTGLILSKGPKQATIKLDSSKAIVKRNYENIEIVD